MREAGPPPDTFLYFAYGSNLDVARLHLNCPSAELVSIARLDGHRLAFTRYSHGWGGGVADVLAAPGDVVWGAVWYIADADSPALDRQEGVDRDPPAYRRISVEVKSPAGRSLRCRTYQVVAPELAGFPPSRAYKETILRGAGALGLPAEYVARLRAIEDNGRTGGGPR